MSRTLLPPAAAARRRPAGRTGRYRADVDGLRLLAVALVVGYHAGVPLLAGGYVGVDVFFVISGYLITGLLRADLDATGTVAFVRFYARRARRLLPMALLVLAVTAVAFAPMLSVLDRSSLAGDISSAALYFANWHFAAASLVYGTDASVNPVLHYWSLSVEEQFYLVWPLLLFVCSRRLARAAGGARLLSAALLGVGTASFVASVVLTGHSEPIAYYGLHTRAWEFAAGGLLALNADQLRSVTVPLRVGAGWVGLAAIVGSALWFGPTTVFPGAAAALPVSGALLVIAAGEGTAPSDTAGAGRLLSSRVMTYGGRTSYSLYLWHWPCLVFVGTLTTHQARPFTVATGWWAAAAVAVAVGLTVLSHHCVENPLRYSRRLRPNRPSLAMAATAMAVTLGITTLALPVSSGVIHGRVTAYALALDGRQPTTSSTLRLTMSAGEARDDRPTGTRSCYASYEQTTAPDTCVFGDPTGSVDVALVGDSVAQALFPALDRVARAEHWRLWVWTKPACPMIELPVRLPQFAGTYPWCSQWRRSVLEHLAALPKLQIVFVSNYGDLLQVPDRFSDASGRPLPASAVGAAWQRAWVVTDRALTADARRVVVIGSPPDPHVDVPRCLVLRAPDETRCSPTRADATQAVDQLVRIESNHASAATRFITLDDLLCPTAACPVVTTDGDIIYRDDRHLTATVSAQLAPALSRVIDRLADR